MRSNQEPENSVVDGLLTNDHEGYDNGVPMASRLQLHEKEGELAEQLQGAWHGMSLPNEMGWVRAHGADFRQGYLFGKPAAPPPLLQLP